jgi:hypothetical protein
MSKQPPKTGAAREIWELDEDEVAAIFEDTEGGE